MFCRVYSNHYINKKKYKNNNDDKHVWSHKPITHHAPDSSETRSGFYPIHINYNQIR